MELLTHSLVLAQRGLRNLARQPWYVALTLVQPLVWLLLYGQLFKRVVELPGFQTTSYMTFLAPGVIVMTAMFSGGWNGMGTIVDIDRGVMDRLLISPVNRMALILGRLLSLVAVTVIQSVILLTVGFLLGARFAGGIVGVLVLILCAVLLAAPMAALSNCVALLVRKQESVIAASNFILLPLTFLSPVFMASDLMPPWIRLVARANPVNWSVQAARSALGATPDWGAIGLRLALLVGFACGAAWLATRAFRVYQRST
jgi:ABC-2 type transport system permease protein